MIDYEAVLKQFKKYVEQFSSNDAMIAMKISHSYHTADLAEKLAKRLEFTDEDKTLFKTIGLLHDIGRFSQYNEAKTYSDYLSNLDYALAGIDFLFKKGHINDFNIPKRFHNIIKKSIENHNKLKIDDGLEEKELFFAKLIRDVDKIDILRQEATSCQKWDFNVPLTESVKETFFKHNLIDKREVQSLSDTIVAEIAYIFDIEFKESYELLKETDNLELYLSVVEIDKTLEDEFECIKQEIRNYLEDRINDE